MDVTHVDNVFVWRIFRDAVASGHEDMEFWRDGDGDGVVQGGGGGIGAPVHGVDADVRCGDDGLDELHVLHRVITDGNARIRFALGRTDMAALGHVGLSDLIAKYCCPLKVEKP